MKCRNCGHPLPPNDRFCQHCGTGRVAQGNELVGYLLDNIVFVVLVIMFIVIPPCLCVAAFYYANKI